jgi:hypothetical protein
MCLIFTFVCYAQTQAFAENIKYTPKNNSPEELMKYVKRAVALVINPAI